MFKDFSTELQKKVFAVWLLRGDKRFLLNFFSRYDTARSYMNGFRHMKIDGKLLMGEVRIQDLIEKGGMNEAETKN